MAGCSFTAHSDALKDGEAQLKVIGNFSVHSAQNSINT